MENLIFKKTEALTTAITHYCPGCTHGVIHRLDPLDDQTSRPDRSQPVEVVDRDGRVEDASDEVGDRALGARERGERQRL